MKYKLPNPPKLIIWQVLDWIQLDKTPDIVLAADISQEFSITMADAANRLKKLQTWGLLIYADSKQKARGGYTLSDYGRRFDVTEKLNKKETE